MEQNKLEELTDQELLAEAKKNTLTPVMNALFIGFLAGIIIFSIIKSTVGLFTLIPLFFIYKLVNQSKNNKEVEKLLKERNLK
jgi:hypothetical protein